MGATPHTSGASVTEAFVSRDIEELKTRLKHPTVLIPLIEALDDAIECGAITAEFVTQFTEQVMTKSSDATMLHDLGESK